MTLALTFVLTMSNVIVSTFRKQIPHNVRIIIQLVIISSLVALADLVLKGFMYSVSKELSVFVALIITNCIVLGRADTFAMNNNVKNSFIDGFANSLGYGIILILDIGNYSFFETRNLMLSKIGKLTQYWNITNENGRC